MFLGVLFKFVSELIFMIWFCFWVSIMGIWYFILNIIFFILIVNWWFIMFFVIWWIGVGWWVMLVLLIVIFRWLNWFIVVFIKDWFMFLRVILLVRVIVLYDEVSDCCIFVNVCLLILLSISFVFCRVRFWVKSCLKLLFVLVINMMWLLKLSNEFIS